MLMAIEWIAGYFGFFIGAMGQAAFIGAYKAYLPVWMAVLICYIPCLLVYTLNFFNRPLFPHRLSRLCWLFASCWFGVVTVSLELLHFLGSMPADISADGLKISRILMHLGWLSFIPITHSYIRDSRSQA
jgi:hypothetical protein